MRPGSSARLLVLLVMLVESLFLVGCVYGKYRSGHIDHPDGRREDYREVSYRDSRKAAQGAGEFLSQGTGFLGSVLENPIVATVLGVSGLGGVAGAAKLLHTLGKQTGRHIGYEERTADGTIQNPLPEGKV